MKPVVRLIRPVSYAALIGLQVIAGMGISNSLDNCNVGAPDLRAPGEFRAQPVVNSDDAGSRMSGLGVGKLEPAVVKPLRQPSVKGGG